MNNFKIAGELTAVTQILRLIDLTVVLPWEQNVPGMCGTYADAAKPRTDDRDNFIVNVQAKVDPYMDGGRVRLKVSYAPSTYGWGHPDMMVDSTTER